MTTKKTFRFNALIACAWLGLAQLGQATVLYWSPTNTPNSMSGPWDTTSFNWTNAAGVAQAWVNAAGNTAVFGGTNASATVLCTTAITAGSITFATSNYTLGLVLGSGLTATASTGATNTLTLLSPGLILSAPGLSNTVAINFSANSQTGASAIEYSGGGTFLVLGTSTCSTGYTTNYASNINAVIIDAGTTIWSGGTVDSGATLQNIVVNGTLNLYSTLGGDGPFLYGGGFINLMENSPGFPVGAVVFRTCQLIANSAGTPVGNFAGSITGNTDNGGCYFNNTGPAMQILSGSNSYAGIWDLRDTSILRMSGPHSFTTNGFVQFAGSAGTTAFPNTLELSNIDLYVSNAISPLGLFAGGCLGITVGPAYLAAVGGDRTVLLTNAANNITWGVSPFIPTTLGFGSVNSDHTLIWAGNFTINSVGTIDCRGSAYYAGNISGAITGTGGFTKTGIKALALTSVSNNYAGGTTINGGSIAINNDAALGTGTLTINTNTGTIQSYDSNTRTPTVPLAIGANPVFGTATTGNLVFNQSENITVSAVTVAVSNASTTFAGSLISSGPGAFAMVGPGSLIFAGDIGGNFSMSTVVSNSTLVLTSSDENNTIPNSPSITVGAGATLDVTGITAPGGFMLANNQTLYGSGAVLGAVSLGNGAIISPASNGVPGTLALAGDLDLLGGGTIYLDVTNIFTVGGGVNDLIAVGGNLNLGTGNTTLNVTPLPPTFFVPGTYTIITYASNLIGTGTFSLSYPASQFMTVDTSTPGQIKLDVTSAPANLVWAGDGTDNAWDYSTPNWLVGSTPSVYADYDAVTFNNSSTNTTVNLNTTVTPGIIAVSNTGTYTITDGGSQNGNITGATSLTKSGAGTLNVETMNTYTGNTVINAGTVNVGGGVSYGALGTGLVTVNTNASLIFNTTADVMAPSIAGQGAVIQQSTNNTLYLSNNPTLTGPVSVRAGEIVIESPAAWATPTNQAAAVSSNAAVYFQDPGNYPMAFSISGTGWSGAPGTGALRFDSPNGTVDLFGPVKLTTDSAIGVDMAGQLAVLSGAVTGAGSLTVQGAGTLALAGTNAYNATTVTSNATLQIGNGGTTGTFGTNLNAITNFGVIAFSLSNNVIVTNQFNGRTGGLQINGPGVVTLTGTNYYDGTTTTDGYGLSINGGTLAVSNATALGAGNLNFASGTIMAVNSTARTVTNALTMSSSMTFGSNTTGDLTFTGDMNTGNNGKTFVINNTNTYFGGNIYGADNNNALVKSGPGTMILTGNSTYTKLTTVAQGLLLCNGSIADSSENALLTGGVAVSSGASFGGLGTVNTTVVIHSGGGVMVHPTQIGTLTLGPSAGSAQPGSGGILLGEAGNCFMKLNAALGTSDTIYSQPGGSFTIQNENGFGSTLTLSNVAGKLQIGQNFQLFSNFSTFISGLSGPPIWGTISPATPGPNMTWNTNLLMVTGLLRIGGPANTPVITSSSVSGGTEFAISGFNGPANGTYFVLSTTNLALPLTNWTVLATNSFDAYGQFAFTNTINPALPQEFIEVEVPAP